MLQVRVSDDIKNKASEIFNALGIDISTAIRIFLLKSIAEGGLPFEMRIDKGSIEAIAALNRMGKRSKELGNDKLTLEEINTIINESRNDKDKKQSR